MRRIILPSILVMLGYFIFLLATLMPLFKWQITQIVTDFPSTYEVRVHLSPWTARLGDSLDHGRYASFGNVYVSRDATDCRYEDVNFTVKRSRIDETLELVSLNIREYILLLFDWKWIGIALSLIYTWWFIIWHKRPFVEAIVLTLIIAVLDNGLTQLIRNLLPTVVHLGTLDCYHGTITFQATLSKIHYETTIVLFAGILLELGALGMMLRQTIIAVIERKS